MTTTATGTGLRTQDSRARGPSDLHSKGESKATPKESETNVATQNTPQTIGKRKRKEDETDGRITAKSSSKDGSHPEEKRLKRFRQKAPQTFLQKLGRAQTQRMIVIGRRRLGDGQELREEMDIVGSTGNIYQVTIARLPECTCPDHRNGNECKHKVYALATILKAPEHLQYQLAFLTDELDEIFSKAPPLPTDVGEDEDKDGKRKPVDGECPICYMDFEEDKNELVWCKAACGNNMHKSCFEQWANSQRGQPIRCVYCRTGWEMETDDVEKIRKTGTLEENGYVNVAEQFGISRARDYSGYYRPWVRRQFGYG